MSRQGGSAAFTLVLSFVSLLFLALAWRLESPGRLGPIVVAGGTLALLMGQIAREFAAPRSGKRESVPHEKTGLGWALALPLAIWLLGCLPAMALHTLLIVRVRGGRSWGCAALCGLLVALPVYAIARLMLRPELLKGALWGGL